MLKIYNTLHRKKEIFKPIKDKKVNIFVCGPTVYDFPHLGHARTYIAFDAFVKYLRYKKYDVFYLQNITDVDDKIISRAKENKESPKKLALRFEKEYLKDMKALSVTSVDKYARATDYIDEIIDQVKRLIDKGYGYKIEDGIYYNIAKFKNYGKLSGRTVAQAEDGTSRIDDAKDKINKGDFCLWKFSKKGEPKWKSSLGDGRPGWHIEDTAITEKFFGAQYDIHGGARDLIFPHHEAEISQIEAVSGKSPMVKYWMHTGFLTINNQKMSKSLKNFITIRNFLKQYPPQYLRFLVLRALWRSPLDYSEKAISEVKSELEKIEEFLNKIYQIKNNRKKPKTKDESLRQSISKIEESFYSYLDDDFNTPKAISAIFRLIKKTNRLISQDSVSKEDARKIYSFLKSADEIFGIIDWRKVENQDIPQRIKELAKQREEYRRNNQWEEADDIREKIENLGYQIEDTPTGTKIKKS